MVDHDRNRYKPRPDLHDAGENAEEGIPADDSGQMVVRRWIRSLGHVGFHTSDGWGSAIESAMFCGRWRSGMAALATFVNSLPSIQLYAPKPSVFSPGRDGEKEFLLAMQAADDSTLPLQ